MLEPFLLNTFSVLTIILAITLFLAKNPVHAVFSLVGVFLFSSIILLLLGLEILTWILILVYVGALAVLILFVVIMLNLQQLPSNLARYLYITGLLIIVIPFGIQIYYWPIQENSAFSQDYTTHWYSLSQLQNIGSFLFYEIPELLLISGFYLLAALTGVILLTKQITNTFIHRQNAEKQVLREWNH